MRIIAYSIKTNSNELVLQEDTGEHIRLDNLSAVLTFLLEPYENSIRVCWDLDTTAATIIKLIRDRDKIRALQETHKCYLPPYSLFYIPEKVFCIKHIPSKFQVSLYGLQQYFPELEEPENVDEVHMFGQKLLDELGKMELHPKKLTSPVSIYDECIMSQMDLPQLKDMPIEAAEMAYNCSGRLWIESHQLGYWDEVYDYDMTSAFPRTAQRLKDFRYCRWIRTSQYQAEATYGYALCKVTVYDWVMVSPIIKEEEEKLISPTGTWQSYLTKGEMDFIDKHHIGEYKIIDGWWAIPKSKKTELPMSLYQPIGKLLEYKRRTPLQALLAKRMSTGVYGKFGEERKDMFGLHFNPCWFAEISTQARLLVAEFLYAYGIGAEDNEEYRSLIHIGVDGAMLTRPVKNNSEKWKLSYQGDALVVSSGLVYTRITKPKGLRLQDILDMIKKQPHQSYYSKTLTRRVKLGDNIARDNPAFIGMKADFHSSIDLALIEHDRYFEKIPAIGKELLRNKYLSRPIKKEIKVDG